MDDERMKNPDGCPDHFDEMLDRIREIRASEKRFYQKVRDLFALSTDYDETDKGREGFIANGARRGLRLWIEDLFIDLADSFYGTNADRPDKKEAKLRRQKDDKTRARIPTIQSINRISWLKRRIRSTC